MSTLSVIIPVYKVEAYLAECVESVRTQTYADLDIILVDDGSPDRCPQLCDALARQDTRITVIHQDNRGLSAARNAGIDRARGSYIAFVDSDDAVTPDYFEVAMDTFSRHPRLDVVELPILARYNTGKALRHSPAATEIAHGRHEIAAAWFAHEGYRYAYAQTKVCRRDLFSNLRFPEGQTFEDVRIITDLLGKARAWAFVAHPTAHYLYRWRDDSITGLASLPDLCSQLQGITRIAAYSQDIPTIRRADRQQFVLAAANLLIDALRAARREQSPLTEPCLHELAAYLRQYRPALRDLLTLPVSLRTKVKNLPLALGGLGAHLRCYT